MLLHIGITESKARKWSCCRSAKKKVVVHDHNRIFAEQQACASADYKHAVTHDLISGWSHHSTYWGGFDGMEWLNGPCPNHPSSCQGNAADHIKNVKVFKIDP